MDTVLLDPGQDRMLLSIPMDMQGKNMMKKQG
jgi:hypothetical protein